MCVRGWYMPGTMSASISEAGRPALEPAASPSLSERSWAFGPSSASRPRPRPFGFFVTISVFHQVLQQDVAFGPACQPGVGIDMAAGSVVHELRIPRMREQARALQFA